MTASQPALARRMLAAQPRRASSLPVPDDWGRRELFARIIRAFDAERNRRAGIDLQREILELNQLVACGFDDLEEPLATRGQLRAWLRNIEDAIELLEAGQ